MPVIKRTRKAPRVRPLRGRKIYVSVQEAQQIAEALDVYGARLSDIVKDWSPSSRAMFVGELRQTTEKFQWSRPRRRGAK